MLALVVDFPALPSCSTELIVTMSHPPHTRLALNEFQASHYSHHKSQKTVYHTIIYISKIQNENITQSCYDSHTVH